MAFDITKRRALETAIIELKNGDGTPLTDDEGNVLSVTVHGPGSGVWREANAAISRTRAARLQKAGGNMAGALDPDAHLQEQVALLARVTVSFNGWEYPGEFTHKQDMFAAAYGDPTLGFIRDHVLGEVNDWAAFTQGLAES